ncbi:hypothetical protein ACWENR_09085 [Micromonospora sp. NPDC004336]
MATLETVGQIADRAAELGIVAPTAVARLADERDEPLSYYGDDKTGALIALMEELGVGVSVGPKVDSLLAGYRDLFDRFAACTGGAVAITGVELPDGEDGGRIRLLVNGDELEWHLEHLSHRYLDTLMIFEIHDLLRADADSRVFVSLMDANGDSGYVFADPVAFSTLAEELQIQMD